MAERRALVCMDGRCLLAEQSNALRSGVSGRLQAAGRARYFKFVRNGVAGRPSLLNRFTSGVLAQP